MPFSPLGVFSLASAAFVPNTLISSASVNADLSDIASGLTTVWGMANTAETDATTALANAATATTTANTAQATANAAIALVTAPNSLIINGGMEVSQEFGTTAVTGISTSIYYLDMFGGSTTGGGDCTIQQVDDAPAATPLLKSLKKSITTLDAALAAGDIYTIGTFIEGYNTQRLKWGTANADSITIGYFVKANRTGTYSLGIANGAKTRAYATPMTINASDTWEFKTHVIPGDVAGAWTTDNTVGIWLTWVMAAGANFIALLPNTWAAGTGIAVPTQINGVAAVTDYMSLTGVIAIPGNVTLTANMLPQFIRPFSQELVACQRYYEKSYDYAVAPGTISTVGANTFFMTDTVVAALSGGIQMRFQTRKRAIPTVTTYSPNLGTSGKIYDLVNAVDVGAGDQLIGETGYFTIGIAAVGSTSTSLTAHFVADARP